MNSNFAILLAILSLLLLLRIKVPTSLRSNITFLDVIGTAMSTLAYAR